MTQHTPLSSLGYASATSSSFGLAVLDQPVPISPLAFQLVSAGMSTLWSRIVAATPVADARPLLLSYDVHPTPTGPLLIAVNTNAGGVLTAMRAARQGGECGLDREYGQLKPRLLELFRGDLLGLDRERAGVVRGM